MAQPSLRFHRGQLPIDLLLAGFPIASNRFREQLAYGVAAGGFLAQHGEDRVSQSHSGTISSEGAPSDPAAMAPQRGGGGGQGTQA